MSAVPKVPKIVGDWKTIIQKDPLDPEIFNGSSVVDHCFFKTRENVWQAWVQIRGTAKGRVFTRWEQRGGLLDTPWEAFGICWEVDRAAGESVGTEPQDDVIQAPYVMTDDDRYLLVYGGGSVDREDHVRQICLAESADGIHFRRMRDSEGKSRIVQGPNHAADPFLLKHDGLYYLYVGTQYYDTGRAESAITVRTSANLREWTASSVAHTGGICGTHTHSSQSVFVCELEGYFYLFKMGWSSDQKTAVYRSKNPLDFGEGDKNLITVLDTAAAEIIREGDRWYLTGLMIPDYGGVRIAELRWEMDPSDAV